MVDVYVDVSPVLSIAATVDSQSKAFYDIHMENAFKAKLIGNVYRGKIVNIVNAIHGAFVDIGEKQNAFIKLNDLSRFYPAYKPGMSVIVQVIKEPYQTKGAQLTGDVSFAGDLVVLLPLSKQLRFSKKFPEAFDRKSIEQVYADSDCHHLGFIVRSEALHASTEDIIREMQKLADMWNRLQLGSDRTERIYQANHFREALVQTFIKPHIQRYITNNADIVMFLNQHGVPKKQIQLTLPKTNLWQEAHLDLQGLVTQKVYQDPRGFSVTIEETEALTVIDVNSSKFISDYKKNETAKLINQESSSLIEKYCSLKNISGMLIIDYIQMHPSDHEAFEAYLREQVFTLEKGYSLLGFTRMGILEVIKTRKSPSYSDLLSFNFSDKDLLYWEMYDLLCQFNKLQHHTNTKRVEVHVTQELYIFIKNNPIFYTFDMDITFKPMKGYQNNYRIITNPIDIGKEM